MKKYDVAQIELARDLYLQFTPVTEIAKRTGMDRSVLYYYINKLWSMERAEQSIEAISNIKEGKDPKLVSIIDSGLNIIRNNLKHLELSKKELSIQEIKIVSTVMSEVDKVRKLDQKKATSISATEEPEERKENKDVTDPFAEVAEDQNEVQ